ncbi:MAG: hypothetical protein F2813_05610 [Actinobacteria bacterium]|uniref:Unannotated protein n=1 Tax=freshwater metagenome TaxID=449393 RepID=A0A6J5ZWD6_9ZZZZ|nr:hypothetical protein [Actinomycetota bacterium]
MFAAELLKVRFMPAPRLALLITVGLVVIGGLLVLTVGPAKGTSTSWYDIPDLIAQIAVAIGAIVLGAWMFGLEFSSKTIRLAATCQPSRVRLVLVKLVSTILLLAVYIVVTFAITLLIEALLASVGQVDFPIETQVKAALGGGIEALLWGVLAFGLTLLFRSYTAGIVAGLVLVLGVDTGLQQIPTVGKYSLGSATTSVGDAVTGDPATLALGAALLTVAVWLIVVTGAGAARFITRDLK